MSIEGVNHALEFGSIPARSVKHQHLKGFVCVLVCDKSILAASGRGFEHQRVCSSRACPAIEWKTVHIMLSS